MEIEICETVIWVLQSGAGLHTVLGTGKPWCLGSFSRSIVVQKDPIEAVCKRQHF